MQSLSGLIVRRQRLLLAQSCRSYVVTPLFGENQIGHEAANSARPQLEVVVTPAPLRGGLAGLLLQMLDAGTRRRRGRVFNVVVRRTDRVGGTVPSNSVETPNRCHKIDGPADRIAEIGCIGVTDFTYNKRAHRPVEPNNPNMGTDKFVKLVLPGPKLVPLYD